MVGAPIQRDRAWILPEYLSAIYNIDYPKDDIHIAFLINGEQRDNTAGIIQDFKRKFKKQYNNIDVWYLKNNHYDSRLGERDYKYIAEIRNIFLSMRKKHDTHIFSVDSDIIIEPNVLKKLLNHDKPIVSALVNNGGYQNRITFYNIMEKDQRHPTYRHLEPSKGLRQVDLTGACYLINKRVLDNGVCYKYHKQGEDAGFCSDAIGKGFKVYCDQDIQPQHIMEKESK